MKTFVVFLVSAAVVCSAASVNNDQSEKNHKKRGLDSMYASDFGGFQPAFGPEYGRSGLVNFASPLISSLHGAAPLNFAGPLPGQLAAGPLPAPLAAGPLPADFAGPLPQGLFQGEHLLQHAHALHAAHATYGAAPLPVEHGLVQAEQPVQHIQHIQHAHPVAQHVPVQFRTLVKNIPVPYERHIHVDNPIYTPVDQQVPIDNPVPVVKYVTQHVPIHVEQQVPVPVVKEERIPEPYLHKVRLVIQRVFLEEAPHKTYIPPPRPNYLPPAPVYGPPHTPFRASPPVHSPPSTNYGVPEHDH